MLKPRAIRKFGVRSLLPLSLALGAVSLGGCAATQTALEHKDLDVQSQMSNSIMLPPVPPSEQTVYIMFKNTSDKNLDVKALEQEIDAALTQQGYRITPFDQAHYLLQANMLRIGRASEAAAHNALISGFGSGTSGLLLAAATAGGSSSSQARAMAGAALLGAAAGTVLGALEKNVTYTAITDIQIGERQGHGDQWKYQRTRLVSTANQANLTFQSALPTLQAQLVHSIAGII